MNNISFQTRKNYSEVYGVLQVLGEEYINKLPVYLYKNLCNLKLKDYSPKYTDKIPLEKQNLSDSSLAMIAFFHISYWCQTDEEKTNLKRLFKQNNDKIKENNNLNTMQIENTNNFKEKNNIINEEENIESISVDTKPAEIKIDLPIEVKKENIFQKIIKNIKNFFHIK